MTVDIFNVGGRSTADFGHPGAIFNYQDDDNYEGWYFRPHSSGTGSAVQYFYFKDGTRPSGMYTCSAIVPGGDWFTVQITFDAQAMTTTVLIDGVESGCSTDA